MNRLAVAVTFGVVAAIAAGCSSPSALEKATSEVREKAGQVQAELSDLAQGGHDALRNHVNQANSATSPDQFGAYVEVNSTTGAVDAVHVSRAITGGGLFYEDETTVLCTTYIINLDTSDAAVVDTKCPAAIYSAKYHAGSDLLRGNTIEVHLDDE